MSRIYIDNSQSIGNTPLVRLNRIAEGVKAAAVLRKGRRPQPGLFGEMPHRRVHDLGRRRKGAAEAGR